MSAIVLVGGKVLGSGGAVFATGASGGGGATLVFNFTTFNGSTPISSVVPGGTGTQGGFAYLSDVAGTDGHQGGTFWYNTQVNIQAFTTNFTWSQPQWDGVVMTAGSPNITIPSANNGLQAAQTAIRFGGNFGAVTGLNTQVYTVATVSTVGGTTTFTVQPFGGGATITPGGTGSCTVTAICMNGMSFTVQTSNLTTQPGQSPYYGLGVSGDANYCGHSGLANSPSAIQYPIGNSINVSWMTGNGGTELFSTAYPANGAPSTIALFVNGGPFNGLSTRNDMNPHGLTLTTGNIYSGQILYDGNYLDIVLANTVTGATARLILPLSNLTSIVGGNTAWVGFTSGMLAAAQTYVRTWNYSTGINTRLAAPTFSINPGLYSGTQTLTLTAAAGAAIWYSTNGLVPTPGAPYCSQYSGAITISSTTNIQAVASQSNYSTSFPAGGVFQIAAASPPIINFPSGFAALGGQLILNGYAYVNGSNYIQLIYDINVAGGLNQKSGVWSAVPQAIGTFSTTFEFTSTGHGDAGLVFVLQNYVQSATSYNTPQDGGWVFGGPSALLDDNISGSLAYACQETPYAPHTQITGYGTSIGVVFDMLTGSYGGVGLYTAGASPVGGPNTVAMASNMNLSSGQTYQAALSYNGTTLSLLLTNTATSATYSTNWTVNIPSLVGASTAYAGFTGSSGGDGNANIQLINWTM